ncbi:RHS repeat protein, partial [Collimonas sp. OK412]|uniref:RHS repeat protein n=1 Tax=Collimonas sp. (strain OK412) TaxID=1801619 RepID=UPI0008EC41BA
MVAIVSGNSLGVSLTSMNTLGQRGVQGVATQGRNGELTYVNVFSGNLVLQDRDDMLVNHGIDIAALRTYNSQGKFTDDNGDNWSNGVYSQQLRINGSLSTAGSSIVRTGRDGSESTYLYDSTRQLYVSTDGSGAYNTISVNAGNGQLVWSNGSSGLKETYDGSGSGRLLSSTDSNGNTIAYSYGANGLLASVTDAAGEATYYDYNGTNLSQIRTVTADGHTLTRVRYSYDASNRLSTVTLDLTPADNAISDNQVYRTTYTYDGNSKRMASVTQSDGSSQSFTYVQVGADYRIATVQDGLNHVTSYNYDTASGRTTVIDPLGLKTLYDYDSKGQLTRITTPPLAGVTASTSFSYNATGDVIQVVDGENHAIDMQYDGNGNQILQRDAAGNTVTRTYDGNNQLVTETTYLVPDPDGAGAGQPGIPLTTRYIYDGSNHNQLRFVVSAEGRVTEYRYNSYGERTSSIQYAGATYGVANLAVIDVPTEAALNTWAGSQNPTQITRTDMAYDARGQLQTSSSWSAVDAQGNGVANGSQTVIQYVYDQAGLLLNTTDGRGGLTQATYDGLGRILTSKDAANQLTISSYDDANHKTTVTQANGLSTISAYDQAGRLVSVQQSNAGQVLGTTQYVYDADDRLRMTQDPTGVRSFILYDDDGRKVADIDGNGSVTEYLYNKDNQLTQTIAYATAIDIGQLADAAGNLTAATLATVRPAASSADHKTWRAYDSANRLSKTVDGQPGLVSEYRYDGASRLVSTISYASLVDTSNLGSAPSANSIAPTASDADRASRSFYDNDGLLRATLDAEGYLTEQRYDSAGHVGSRVGYATQVDASLRAAGTLAQLLPAASTGDIVTQLLLNGKGQIAGEIDGEGYLTEKVYDGNGNVVKTVRYANKVTAAVAANTTVADVRPAASADDHVTATDYDALNRIKQQTNAEGTVTQYMYDNAGNLSQTIRAAGTSDVRAISARYDIQGRLTGELSAEGNAQLTGNQTQAQIDAIWTSYGLTHTYDAAGRRTSTTDQNGNKTLFFYDVDNRLTQTVNALGEVSEKQYNSLGQLVATVQYGTRISTSGLAGGLVSAALTSALNAVRNSSLDSVNSFTYNANGTLATSTDALKNITTYSYDAFGERVSSTTNIDATHALTQTSSYDRRGLVVATVADPLGVNATTSTQYDAFGRIIRSVDANGNVRSQSYDRLGRIVQTVEPLNAQRSTTYDAFDRTLTQTDGLGNVTRYSYSTTARSTTLTTPEGVVVTTVKTRNGQTQSVTDGLGNVTQYSYDKNGNLLSTVTPLTTTSGTYDHANRLISTIDARGTITAFSFDAANRVLTRQVDPNGLNLITRYQYDAKGQQVVTTDANGVATQISFNLKGQALSQTLDPAGLKLTTQYSYDGSGNVLTVTSPGGTVTQYVYDNLGRRIEQHVDPSGLNLTTNTSYDKKGNAVTVTDPNRNVTRYVYDANDHLAFTVDAQGDVTQTTYDANGRVLQTTRYATPISLAGLSAAPVPADIQSRLASNATDATELRRYDRDGRLTWIIDATGAVTQNSYDANGNVVKRLAYATRLGANDLAALKASAATVPAPATDAAHDRITQIAYDALGRAIYIVDASGAVVEQHYDGNGNSVERITYAKTIPVGQPATMVNMAQQLASIADPVHDGHIVNVYDSANRLIYTANAAGAASQIGYDNNNNVVRRTDYVTLLTGPLTATTNLAAVSSSSADQTSNYVYDAANRRIYSVDAMGAVTQQIYDANGYVTQTVRYAKSVAIPVITAPAVDDSVTVYVYDAAGRVIQQTKAAGTAASGTVIYGYDAMGNAISITNERGYTTTQQFDSLGRKVSTSVPLNDGADGKTPQYAVTTTQYDAFGNAVKIIDPLGNAGYFYYDQDSHVVLQIDPLGYATQTSYTASGKPSLVVRYATPVNGPLSTSAQPALTAGAADAPTKLEYDQNDRLVKSTDAEGNFELFGYDGAGNRISYQNKVGGVTTSTYDGRGLLLSETLPIASRNSAGVLVPVVKQYSYDARGNRTQMIEAAGLPEQRTTNYIYDQNNRLITQSGDAVTIRDAKGWSVGSPTQHWTYDAAGNKTSYTDANGNRTSWYYDAANRKIAELSAAGTLSVWSYDAASNMTSTRVYGDAVVLPAGGTLPTAVNQNNYRQTNYSYDKSNRQVQTLIDGATFAQRPIGGTSLNIYTGSITTSRIYDALGNVIVESDGMGNQTLSYYNKVGKKIAQVDAENYLTVWTRDQNDSVTVEYRYANRLSIVPTTDSVVSQLAQNAGSNSNDRITTSSYDPVNRLLTQSRLNLVTSSINGSGGLVTATGAATTRYAYDGLGNVIEKTEANGDVSDWIFDAMGRQTRAQGASFIDFEGASVRPTTDTVYDGLGNVQQSIVRGKNSADDRVTNFAYDVAGHLGRKSTQGVDGSYEYFYDAVGNVTEARVLSKNSDGGNRWDATVILYDATNHELSRQQVTAVGGDPSKQQFVGSDTHQVRYNAYGEVVGKGINGSTAEFAEYDSLGRLWKTNAGDGATKVYLYDASGNATVLIQSAGADMRTMTLAQILAISQTQGVSADPVVQAAIAAGGIHMTVSVYDRRNQLVDTYQPTMQSAHNLATIQEFLTQQAGSNFSGGSVTLGPTKATESKATAPPAVQGAVAISKMETVNFSFRSTKETMDTVGQPTVFTRSYSITVPPSLRYGGGNLHVKINGGEYAAAVSASTGTLTFTQSHASWTTAGSGATSLVVEVYQDTPDGAPNSQFLIARTTIAMPNHASGTYSYDDTATGAANTTPVIQFQAQSPLTDRIIAMIRPLGTNQPWTWFTPQPMKNSNGGVIAGWFSADWSGWPDSNWLFQYVALAADGTVLNSEAGPLNTSSTTPSMYQQAQPVGGSGQAFLSRDNLVRPEYTLNITQQGVAANSMRIRYRHVGSGEAWTTQVVGAASTGLVSHYTPGWFMISTIGWSGSYEYSIETYTGANATGTMLNRASGSLVAGDWVSDLTSWTSLPENVAFGSQPANAATMHVNYSVRGGASGSADLTWDAVHQQFNWDASGLVPDRFSNYVVDYNYQTMDAGGAIVNAAHGALQLGSDRLVLSHQNDAKPATITFSPPVANAAQLVLQYRNAGSTGAYSSVTLSRTAGGSFIWNVDALRPASGSLSLEYAYSLLDASGQPVAVSGGNPRAQGTLEIGADRNGAVRQLQWTVTGLNNTAPDIPNTQAAIHRSQVHNAFGDVSSEIDGRGNRVMLAYDTMGQLVSKQAPETNVTLENGTIIRATPTTQYYYDASSHLVGVRDANGNLNSMTQLAGFGDATGNNTRITKEFHADGGSKTNAYDIFGDLRTATDELTRVTSNTYDQAGRLIQVVHAARQPGTASNPGPTAVSSVDSYTYDTLGNRISHTNAMQQRETTDYDPDGRVIRTRSYAGQEVTYTYSYDQTILGVGSLPVGGWVKVTSYTGSRSASDKTDYFGHTTSHQDFGGHVVTYSYDYAAHLKNQSSTAGQNVDYSYYANGYVKSTTDHALNMLSYFEYDEEGNRTRESYTTADAPANRIYYQLADIKYDELNRVVDYVDPQAHIQYQYDANGNRRRVLSSYNDAISGAPATQDFWYKYDSQNRFVLTMGQLSNGVIGLGANGVQIGYDVAGQRRSASYADGHSEAYDYTSDGYLEDVRINGVLRSRRGNDLLGRVQNYSEYADNGSTVIYNKASQFDADNRLLQDT